MAIGPGKYDELANYCLKESEADAVVVIIFGGNKGSGMSGKEKVVGLPTDYEIAGKPYHLKKLPTVLRHVAKTIESAPPEAFIVP